MYRYEREEKKPASRDPRPNDQCSPPLMLYILNYSSFNNKRFNTCIFQRQKWV